MSKIYYDFLIAEQIFAAEGQPTVMHLCTDGKCPHRATSSIKQCHPCTFHKAVPKEVFMSNCVQIHPETCPAEDNITRPKHYTGDVYEPIHVINAWNLNFSLGNVIKYIARAGKKKRCSRLEDLKKARQYIDFEIAEEEKKHANK